MFWHGPALTRLERLSMSSFIANGHPLILHCYEPPAGVPEQVQIADAARTLPRQHLFRERRSGSVAHFADWFRFQVLHDQGGIWADTDVVCLKPLRYRQAEIFGWEDQRTINIAVLGLPAGHELAAALLECWRNPTRVLPWDSWRTRRRKWLRRLLPGDDRPYVRWGELGTQAFTEMARRLGYDRLALPFWHFYPVHYMNWQTIFDDSLRDNLALIEASSTIHLWNEMTRREPGFDKNGAFAPDSLFERLCARYLRSGS
jgi:Alpha 1,4-glycosyltransferase conserved region/Glycosyltransferase sugar-binding region containing DXD motif